MGKYVSVKRQLPPPKKKKKNDCHVVENRDLLFAVKYDSTLDCLSLEVLLSYSTWQIVRTLEKPIEF